MELYAIQKQKKFGCAPNPFEKRRKNRENLRARTHSHKCRFQHNRYFICQIVNINRRYGHKLHKGVALIAGNYTQDAYIAETLGFARNARGTHPVVAKHDLPHFIALHRHI